MPCSSPLRLVNPHYHKLARENSCSVYEYGYMEDFMISVPCGHCLQCLKKRQQHWFQRAHHIYKSLHLRPKDCYFCTFTLRPGPRYEEAKKYPYKPIRRFIDRLRKHPSLKGRTCKFPYFFVVEFADGATARKRGLSSQHRMHYHAIFFACPLMAQTVRKVWESIEGRAEVDMLRHEGGVRYTLKYMSKDRSLCQHYLSEEDMAKNGKLIVSHGFGRLSREDMKRLRSYMSMNLKSFFCSYIGNFAYSIPRYWKDKCFTKDEIKELHRLFIPPLLYDSIRRDYPDYSEMECYILLCMSLPWSWSGYQTFN